jgi:hypothetical protein
MRAGKSDVWVSLRRRNGLLRPTGTQQKDCRMDQVINVEGIIIKVPLGTMFHVAMNTNQHQVLAHISGKMHKRFIRPS